MTGHLQLLTLESCAQLMIQFVPGDLMVAGSVVMAGFGVCVKCACQ